jgi:hypothetical protein
MDVESNVIEVTAIGAGSSVQESNPIANAIEQITK